jgi:hypothetical protein
MYFLERACTMQVRTRALGGKDYPTEMSVIEKNMALSEGEGLTNAAKQLVWPALMRKLDRTDPSFRN